MRRVKIVSREEIVNQGFVVGEAEGDEIFGAMKEKIIDVVGKVLGGLKESLEEELSGIGLLVMQSVMNLEIEKVAGKKGKHQKNRRYNWWGTNPGSIVLDGQKVPCLIPRAMRTETQKAYTLKSHGLFQNAGDLVRRAYRDLIRGVSTRQYREGVGEFLKGYGASAASVSRRMIKATSGKVKELLNRDLKELKLAVLMIDGLRVGNQLVVVALGVDTEGFKQVLGLWQGSTENARVAKSLLTDLVARGLDLERPLLVVMDGSKALRSAIDEILGTDTWVQRRTEHKKRNVVEHLSEEYQQQVRARMKKAYDMVSEEKARAELEHLAKDLENINPSAARSLREGLEETLTLHRLGIPEELKKCLQSTNLIESTISGVRKRVRNVTRWPDGARRSPKAHQVERWIGAGLVETEKKFRRINAYGAMKALVDALATKGRTRDRVA